MELKSGELTPLKLPEKEVKEFRLSSLTTFELADLKLKNAARAAASMDSASGRKNRKSLNFSDFSFVFKALKNAKSEQESLFAMAQTDSILTSKAVSLCSDFCKEHEAAFKTLHAFLFNLTVGVVAALFYKHGLDPETPIFKVKEPLPSAKFLATTVNPTLLFLTVHLLKSGLLEYSDFTKSFKKLKPSGKIISTKLFMEFVLTTEALLPVSLGLKRCTT